MKTTKKCRVDRLFELRDQFRSVSGLFDELLIESEFIEEAGPDLIANALKAYQSVHANKKPELWQLIDLCVVLVQAL